MSETNFDKFLPKNVDSPKFYLLLKTDLEYYNELKDTHEGDSGFDLITPEDIHFNENETKLVNLKVKTNMIMIESKNNNSDSYQLVKNMFYKSYNLRARSSIFKTNVRIANNQGLIDANYMGDIKVALDNIKPGEYILKKGTSIVQLALGCLSNFEVFKVEDFPRTTSRGENGFGSTGN